MKQEAYVVTGGCGFLGQFIVADLSRAFPDSRIRIVDLKPNRYAFFEWKRFPNVEITTGVDICDQNGLSDCFRDAGVVIHAAGIVGFSLADRDRLFHVHETGTENVLFAARQAAVRRVIHVSSVAALGFGKTQHERVGESFDFDWKIAERKYKYYMLSKRNADKIAFRYRREGMDVRIAYPSLMFGPGDASNSIHLIRGIHRQKIPFVMPGGNAVSDVRDVAKGIVAMSSERHTCQDFVLAAHNLSSRETFTRLARLLRVKPPTRQLPKSLGPVLFRVFWVVEKAVRKEITLSADSIDSAFRHRYFDASKARTELNWEPRALDATLTDSINWLKEHDLLG